jgi:hypothetical protein
MEANMALNQDASDVVSPAEICACAHVADRLIKLKQRDLAEKVIEAIYYLVSSSNVTEIPPYGKPAAKPELVLIQNERFGSQDR